MNISAKKAYAGLIFINVLWGISFPVMDACLTKMGPFTLVAIRYFMAALVLTALVMRGRKIRGDEIKSGIFVGIPYAAAAVLQMIGLQQTSVANASFITGLTVVFVPLLVFLLEKRVPAKGTLIGICLSLCGMACMCKVWGTSLNPGDLWVLAACLSFSVQIYNLEKFGKGKDSTVLTCVLLWTVTVLIAPLAFMLEGGQSVSFDWKVILALLFIGVICTALGIYLQSLLQPCVPAARAAVIYLLEPVSATAFAWILGEALQMHQFIGGVVILAGAWIIIRDENRG